MGLKPELKVAHDLGICLSTLLKWSKDSKLNFPPRITINGRNFRDSDAVNAFVTARAALGVEAERVERGKAQAERARSGKKRRAEAHQNDEPPKISAREFNKRQRIEQAAKAATTQSAKKRARADLTATP
jgi:hypothetical protein